MLTQGALKKKQAVVVQIKLNIYEAYYENCQYAYILEYFVQSKATLDLVAELKKNEAVDIGVYKECMPAVV